MKQYRRIPAQKSIIKKTVGEKMEIIQINKSTPCLTIEQRLRDMKENNEPISDRAQIIFTERKDGVKPEYDIRTDKFDTMLERITQATDKMRDIRAKKIEMKGKKTCQKQQKQRKKMTKVSHTERPQ